MIKLDVTYSDYVNTTDPKYPAGRAVDASGEENTDGTPLLAKWMNDINGTRQAIIKEAFGDMSGVSGVPDDVENSDVLKALKKIMQGYTNQRFIDYYKNGYVQWPGMPSPLEDTSLHFEGYSWYETNYDGNFFRAKGRNANPFSSTRFTMEQIKNGTYAFEADEQGDAIRNIKGKVESFYNSVYIDAWLDNDLFHPILGDNHYGDLGGQNGRGFTFDMSRVVPTAEENRSRNLTFTIWALVKDE